MNSGKSNKVVGFQDRLQKFLSDSSDSSDSGDFSSDSIDQDEQPKKKRRKVEKKKNTGLSAVHEIIVPLGHRLFFEFM